MARRRKTVSQLETQYDRLRNSNYTLGKNGLHNELRVRNDFFNARAKIESRAMGLSNG